MTEDVDCEVLDGIPDVTSDQDDIIETICVTTDIPLKEKLLGESDE